MISNLDYTILQFISNHHLPGSVWVMQLISDHTTWINISAIVIVALTAVFRRSKSLMHHFFTLVVVITVSALMVYLLKNVFDRERPFITYPDIVKLSSGGDSSFPSGHTTETFAMAAAFATLFRKRCLSIAYFGWAVVVAYTRLALGVHYPSDVVGGALLGIITGIGLSLLANRLFDPGKHVAEDQ